MNNFVTVKTIVDENFQDYKKASMFIVFPKCDFKYFRELSLDASKCQNYEISKMKDIKVSVFEIFKRYTSNPITSAIVLGGLEPFKSFDEVYSLISYFRTNGCAPLGREISPLQFTVPGNEELLGIKVDAVGKVFAG